jgi:hypothetical protein
MKRSDLIQHFLGLVTSVFQHPVSVVSESTSSDIEFLINWKLANDPSRPSKRSKTIRLIFTQELIEDYLALEQSRRPTADVRVCRALTSRIQAHDPEHDHPVSVPPPEVDWIISTNEVNF